MSFLFLPTSCVIKLSLASDSWIIYYLCVWRYVFCPHCLEFLLRILSWLKTYHVIHKHYTRVNLWFSHQSYNRNVKIRYSYGPCCVNLIFFYIIVYLFSYASEYVYFLYYWYKNSVQPDDNGFFLLYIVQICVFPFYNLPQRALL